MKRKAIFFAWILFLLGTTASATVSSGTYRIKSNAYDGRYITENRSNQTLVTSALTEGNYAQVWNLSVSGSDVTLCNVLTGRYIQRTPLTAWSVQYTTGESAATFQLGETNGTVYFTDAWSAGLHCAQSDGYNVVFWSTDADASKWVLEAVEINVTDLLNQQLSFHEASTQQLTTFFTTTACTELKGTYATMSDTELRSAMSELPTATQDMAVKMKNNTWATYYTGWDKTEKTFRIADYKPYSSHTRWTELLFLDRTLGRLSNPTGIWVNAGDYLQVYVGDIPDGESVSLEVAGYEQGSGTTYHLHEGMNVLLMATSGNCFVFYEVDNTTNGGKPYKALSTYADVTVHIEGGTVQGYFDLTKGDTDADWAKMIDNGNTLTNQSQFCMKSKTLTYNVRTDLLKAGVGSDMESLLKVWQDIQDWEDELMGRSFVGGENYAYCNNVHSVVTVSGSGRLYASSYGVYFSPDVTGIYNPADLNTGGGIWASLHELGHHRQRAIKMTGTTETSNNLFSNVGLYNQGRVASRCAGVNEVLACYRNHESWPERVSMANREGFSDTYNSRVATIYWQLYLYFHIYKGQESFFPNLFEALRQDPMVIHGTDAFTLANEDYLKFYVKCCEVSGYDLTEFFEVYGFFMMPPTQEEKTLKGVTSTTYQTVSDYTTSYLHVTQSMIDNAKQTVANMNLPKCDNMIFIEDRVTAPLATYEGHVSGEKRTMYYSGSSFGEVGDVGQYTDFDITPSAYTYNINSDGIVTMSGTGAVGYKVYDNNGNVVAFYNTNTFRLSSDFYNVNGLKSGYTIKAAAGDGSVVKATRDASIVINAPNFPKSNMWYTMNAKRSVGRYVMSNGADEGITGVTSSNPLDKMQWKFVLRNGAIDEYDIINRGDGSYISPVSQNSQIYTSTAQPSAGWKLGAANTQGMYIIYSGSTQFNQTDAVYNYKLFNWGGGSNTSDEGCQFSITEVEAIDIPVVHVLDVFDITSSSSSSTLSSTPLGELAGLNITVSNTAANTIETGQWYVMFDRGTGNGAHGYLYENSSSHTLYNTATTPSGTAENNAKYLVRLVGSNGNYYLQTGFGNYFGEITHKTNVPTTAQKDKLFNIKKIDGEDAHYYIQSQSSNVVLDANDLHNGDATVVGWNTDIPSSTGGNNDWAFYPVELTHQREGKTVGDGKYYSTAYMPFDYELPDGVKAYTITISGDQATAHELIGGVPAGTGVLLISEGVQLMQLGYYHYTASVNNNSLDANRLTGSYVELMPGDPDYPTGDFYVFSGKNNEPGFYRYSGTLGAYKAFLVPPSGSSKDISSFTIVFDENGEVTGIDPIDDLTNDNMTIGEGSIYDLSGRKVMSTLPDSQTPKLLRKGIYIVKGKKIVVK